MAQQEKAVYLPSATARTRRFRAGFAPSMQRFITFGGSPAPRSATTAELIAVSAPKRPRRVGGTLRDQIWMAPDFDELPPDILAAMLGEDE